MKFGKFKTRAWKIIFKKDDTPLPKLQCYLDIKYFSVVNNITLFKREG